MGDVADLRHNRGEGAEAPRERFNYRGKHRYLIVLPFARPIAEHDAAGAVLKLLGVLRDRCWAEKFEILAYCVMPDRMTLVARGETAGSDMHLFLKGFRTAAGEVLAAGGHFWMKKYRERVLRKHELTSVVAMEFFREPVRAGLARRIEEYPYLGSFTFAREKSGRVKFRD